ncbi:MAG: hypothetical protein FD138_473 [Planctomycetota bacterium]|nr:MAG: hypothetical protein FD138_473 [Planctomycetota bacterium]
MSVTIQKTLRQLLIPSALVVAVMTLHVENAAAQDNAKGEWSQLLGPQRNGISSETGTGFLPKLDCSIAGRTVDRKKSGVSPVESACRDSRSVAAEC